MPLAPSPSYAPPPFPTERHVLVSSAPDTENKARDIDGLLDRCCERGGCLLDSDFSTERGPPVFPRRSRPSTPQRHSDSSGEEGGKYDLAPLIFSTASAAQWRRRGASVGNSQRERERQKPRQARETRTRPPQDLVLRVAIMEEVHGVDVSWLHKSTKEKSNDKDKPQHPGHRRHVSAAPVFNAHKKQPSVSTSDVPQPRKPQSDKAGAELSKLPSPPNVTPPTPVQPSKDTTQAIPSTPTPPSQANGKTTPKRPNMMGRQSSEKLSDDAKGASRRQSWMNSLSSKFSGSQAAPPRPSPTPTQPAGRQFSGNAAQSTNGPVAEEAVEEVEQYTPPKQKESSFFSNLTRRLSAASQSSGIPKVQGTGGVCPRKVLNVDPNRERCLVPEMDPNRLRKVSFCVDVEIAGGPRYYDDDEDDEARKQRKKEFKMKERAEGEALKRPEALTDEKENEGEPKLESKSRAVPIPGKGRDEKGSDENLAPKNSLDDEASTRKREKKKKSEEERKERKEKRRRRAEENGSIPVELSLDQDGEDAKPGSSPSGTPSPPNGVNATQQPQAQVTPPPTRQDRPTVDPARIYRRCCQLRETPILKRITEQLMNPKSNLPTEPGIVTCLDLTGSRLQLADVVTLGDWLAVVPVKHLKLEDADLNDEGVRCILAGLLAAKRPEQTKRRSGPPKHREGLPNSPHKERAGVVERITFKNNPRITRLGWKHISLFLYMCRSLKAFDMSMNQFPDTLPPSVHSTPVKSPQTAPAGNGEDVDAAEVLYKCLSERLAGSKLEEFIVSECGLSAAQIRKIVDGCIVSGVSRLGLAGNHLDDDGLEHIIHYLRSNVCQALDLGGNDLRGKLGIVAEALRSKARTLPCWGLSLADCNLDSASLKPLFATLQQLPNFRFIDLSHNRDLCSADNGLISLLRRYVSQMKNFKRIHLTDVGMSAKQAIALADVLPEGPRLAHLNLMENPKLQALADAKTEEDQEEACALYASLMAAVRVSSTLICIDIDVPSAESSELVKALAKQVVAYSLRNMEEFAIAEATGHAVTTANATAALTEPHGGEKVVKDISVPDVLWHLVGHVEGNSENHDHDAPAPDEDYIVGGTGVVKALQYVLGEKANDARRTSLPQTPRSGTVTPTLGQRPDSSAGLVEQQRGKAKKMSSDLLGSARKIRSRLQPALMKEATAGDEMAYRRLLFLDQTLQSMIERFEDEFPECRVPKPSAPAADPSSLGSADDKAANLLSSSTNTQGAELASNVSDDDDFIDAEDGEPHVRPTMSRHNSDVSLASRKQVLEEGHVHRMGIQLRREIIRSDGENGGTGSSSPVGAAAGASSDGPPDQKVDDVAAAAGSGSVAAFPARASSLSPLAPNSSAVAQPNASTAAHPPASGNDEARLRALGARMESLSGVDLRQVLQDNQGWENALRKIGANYEDLRRLQEMDPEGWEGFKTSQRLARENMERERPGSGAGLGGGEERPPPVPPKD